MAEWDKPVEWIVRTTAVKRTTVHHRVFASSKAEAIDLVIGGKGERVNREDKFLEKPSHGAKRRKKGE